MLKHWWGRAIAVLPLVALVVYFLGRQSSLIPEYAEYCSKNEYTDTKECPSYHIILFVFLKIGKFLASEHGLLTALATVVIALFTLRLGKTTDRLVTATGDLRNSTDKLWEAAIEQGKDIKASAIAADRASTIGRAYIFIEYETPQAPRIITLSSPTINPDGTLTYFRVPIRFSFKNWGQTPAIITRVEAHLLIDEGGGREPPDPFSPEGIAMRETFTGHHIIPKFEKGSTPIFLPISADGSPMRVMLPASSDTGTLEQTFAYTNRARPLFDILQDAWFYCAVTYKDIFGHRDRHTWYYVQLAGAGVTYPADSKYNRWD